MTTTIRIAKIKNTDILSVSKDVGVLAHLYTADGGVKLYNHFGPLHVPKKDQEMYRPWDVDIRLVQEAARNPVSLEAERQMWEW